MMANPDLKSTLATCTFHPVRVDLCRRLVWFAEIGRETYRRAGFLVPRQVRMGEARDFVSAAASMEREFKQLRATQPIGFGWMASDLNESGAVGDAANATVAKGEACAERGADAFVDLLRDVAAFDLARLVAGPIG